MERRRRALGLRKLNPDVPEDEKKSKLSSGKSSRANNSGGKHREGRDLQSRHIANKDTQSKYNANVSPTKNTLAYQNDSTLANSAYPRSPVLSPGIQTMFPGNIGSPEIEVSWDWGCSQVLKETVLPRQPKRVSQHSHSPPVVVTVPICPRFPLVRHMSEEENQERLAFYKNILSKSFKRNPEQSSNDLQNNNLKDGADPEINNTTTPKRPSKEVMCPGKNQEQVNAFFDDSANEFMLECSQAIEEKLKNGEIDMGPIVSVSVSNGLKHGHSPVIEPENAHKRKCQTRSKLNLFPEESSHSSLNTTNTPGEKRRLSLKSPQNKQLRTKSHIGKDSVDSQSKGSSLFGNDDDILFIKPPQADERLGLKRSASCGVHSKVKNQIDANSEKPVRSTNETRNDLVNLQINTDESRPTLQRSATYNSIPTPIRSALDKKPLVTRPELSVNNNSINGKNCVQNKKTQDSVNSNQYDSVDKFRRFSKGNPPQSKVENKLQPPGRPNNVIKPIVPKQEFNASNKVSLNNKSGQLSTKNGFQDSHHNVDDFTSLLDDGFDSELSNLDFDSLCCNSQPSEPSHPEPTAASKMCSQQEIEAKRLAALNRLKMRKKL